MWIFYLSLTVLLLILTLLPKIQHSHWVFRVPEFGKIQITFLILFTIGFGFTINTSEKFWYYQGLLFVMFIHHSVTLVKYTPLYPVKKFPGNIIRLKNYILSRLMFISLIKIMIALFSS
jgi:hypothetical protein